MIQFVLSKLSVSVNFIVLLPSTKISYTVYTIYSTIIYYTTLITVTFYRKIIKILLVPTVRWTQCAECEKIF